MKTNVSQKITDQSEIGVKMAGVSLKCFYWPEERSDRQPNEIHLVVFLSSSSQEDRAFHVGLNDP